MIDKNKGQIVSNDSCCQCGRAHAVTVKHFSVACITVSTRAFNLEYKDSQGKPIDESGNAMKAFINQNSELFYLQGAK